MRPRRTSVAYVAACAAVLAGCNVTGDHLPARCNGTTYEERNGGGQVTVVHPTDPRCTYTTGTAHHHDG